MLTHFKENMTLKYDISKIENDTWILQLCTGRNLKKRLRLGKKLNYHIMVFMSSSNIVAGVYQNVYYARLSKSGMLSNNGMDNQIFVLDEDEITEHILLESI